jgi:hypothetical protein
MITPHLNDRQSNDAAMVELLIIGGLKPATWSRRLITQLESYVTK